MVKLLFVILGILLAIIYFIWVLYGKHLKNKTLMLTLDVFMIVLCIVIFVMGLRLRDDMYDALAEPTQMVEELSLGTESATN